MQPVAFQSYSRAAAYLQGRLEEADDQKKADDVSSRASAVHPYACAPQYLRRATTPWLVGLWRHVDE